MLRTVSAQKQYLSLEEKDLEFWMRDHTANGGGQNFIDYIAYKISTSTGVRESNESISQRIVYCILKSNKPWLLVKNLYCRYRFDYSHVNFLFSTLQDKWNQPASATFEEKNSLRIAIYSMLKQIQTESESLNFQTSKSSPEILSFPYPYDLKYLIDYEYPKGLSHRDIVIMLLVNPLRALSVISQRFQILENLNQEYQKEQ
jgi:hypothetical protein